MLETKDFWPIVRTTAVWWSPIVAGYIGAFGVHLLTQSREREKWILDSKKAEYRELLSALSQAHMSTSSGPPGFANKEDQQPYSSIAPKQTNSERIFSDRIFITKDLPLLDLQKSWRKAMEDYSNAEPWTLGTLPTPVTVFDMEYDRIKDEIVAVANQSVPKTAWQRLMFWKE
jgi:hypothetical protein